MRCARSFAWVKSAVLAGALLVAAAGIAPGALAQEKYDRLIVFGDSYADLTLSDKPASNPLAPVLPDGTPLSIPVWRVYPAPLKENLGIPEVLDYAVGGATVRPGGSAVVPPNLNLPDQVGGFSFVEGQSFGPRDLVTLSIGGNDFLQFFAGSGQTPEVFGKATADAVAVEIGKLVGAGARTFAIAGFSGMSNLGENVIPDGAVEVAADGYATAYFNGLQANLVPLAQDGVRFFMLDVFRLGKQAVADPRYGFTATELDNGIPIESRCPSPAACPVNNPDNPGADKYVLGPDGLHLTSDGFQLVADYMANIVMAPDTIAVQPGIVMTTTDGFGRTLLGRLDSMRATRVAAGVGFAPTVDGRMGLGVTDRASTPQTAGRVTSYALGSFLGGNRSEGPDVAGYDYDSTAGTAGLEYAVNRNLILGLAANYTTTGADLHNGADIDLDAIQGAAYLSYATRQVFADVVAAYGTHDVGLVRPGVLDPVRSSADADAFALAARGGYLFDLGGLRAGPIAGITYVRSRVDGYTEKGDALLTFKVSDQTLESLAGNIGIRFLAPFRTAGGNLVIPHLNVMLEHQLGDDARTLTTTLTQAPLLPIHTDFANFESRTYGRVEGGVTVELGPQTAATVNAASTFARDEGQDFRISAGLNFRF